MNPVLLTLLLFSGAIAALLIFRQWPEYSFWIIILLLFDPTGHFSVYFGKDALGGFYYRDFLFAMAFFPLLSPGINVRSLFHYRPFLVLLGVQLLFLFYHLFIYGYLQPGKGWGYLFRYVMIRERMSVFGFLLIVPAFAMARRNLSFLVDLLVISTVLIYILFFVSILSDADLIPVWQAERYRGTGILRFSMFSSGLTDMLIPLAFFVFARKVAYRYRNLLYTAFVLVILATLLSLTKSNYINLAGLVVASLFLFYRFYRPSFHGLLYMLLGPALIMFILMFIVFPEYPEIVWRQVEDLWLFLSGGAYTSGAVEGRLVNQWPAHLALIKERPFFGTGAGFSDFFSMRFDPSDYEVTDLPITGHLAMYGIVGLIVYSVFYVFLWHYLVVGFKRFKTRINQISNIDCAFYFVVFAWMVKNFLFKPNYLFNELTTGTLMINLYAAILLGLLYRQNTKRES